MCCQICSISRLPHLYSHLLYLRGDLPHLLLERGQLADLPGGLGTGPHVLCHHAPILPRTGQSRERLARPIPPDRDFSSQRRLRCSLAASGGISVPRTAMATVDDPAPAVRPSSDGIRAWRRSDAHLPPAAVAINVIAARTCRQPPPACSPVPWPKPAGPVPGCRDVADALWEALNLAPYHALARCGPGSRSPGDSGRLARPVWVPPSLPCRPPQRSRRQPLAAVPAGPDDPQDGIAPASAAVDPAGDRL